MCFSMEWIEQLLIWAVIVIAIIAILKLLIPYILSQLGGGGIIVSVINILLWAIIAIFIIYFCFAVISCLMSMGGGGGLPLFPHHH